MQCGFLSKRIPGPKGYVHTSFSHARGPARVHYYPPRNGKLPKDVIIFVPGNPGLIDYYIPFLLKLQSHIAPHFALLAHSHIGHSPTLSHPTTPLTLSEQIETKVDFVRSFTQELLEARREEGLDTEKIKIGFIGHSVGSEIIIQTMRRLEQDQLSADGPPFEITASFLLFPTIAHIAKTPNGRKLRPIFNPPLLQLLPLICTVIQPLIWTFRLLLSVIPSSFFRLGGIYAPNTTTLDFLGSPATVRNVLHLAKSEMSSIKAPDLGWYRSNKARIWSYWGEPDGWVGEMGEEVKKVLRETETEGSGSRVQEDGKRGRRVVDCVDSVPHAFCLAHSDIIADKVAGWIAEAFRDRS